MDERTQWVERLFLTEHVNTFPSCNFEYFAISLKKGNFPRKKKIVKWTLHLSRGRSNKQWYMKNTIATNPENNYSIQVNQYTMTLWTGTLWTRRDIWFVNAGIVIAN